LYETTIERHDELEALLLDPDMSGEPLKKALASFFFSFQGIKGCTNHTTAAATMVHTVSLSEGFDLRIRQTLIVGIGLDSRGKEQIASTATATSKLPARVLLYNQLEELRNEERTGLLSIVVTILCVDPNREQ
jgi:hypothetical protein